jgi:hypothetical protein
MGNPSSEHGSTRGKRRKRGAKNKIIKTKMSIKDIETVFCLSEEDVELQKAEDDAQREAEGLEDANIDEDFNLS